MGNWVIGMAVVLAACGGSKSEEAKGGVGAAPPVQAGAPAVPGSAVPSSAIGATTSAAPANLGKALEGDWADRLLAIMVEQPKCASRIGALEALAAEAATAGQTVWQGETLAAIANCLASEKQPEQAVSRLAQAVELGYSDCYFLRSDEHMKSLAGTPGYDAVLAKLKTSLADVQETAWTVAEYQAVFHDTSMMITEEMNRVDSEITKVSQSAVPTRPTTSASVVAGRAMLLAVQRYQQVAVLQADKQRVEHNTSMGIIESMGDGAGGGTSDLRIRQSRLAAADAAGARRRAVEARAFKPSGASTEMVACSSIPD